MFRWLLIFIAIGQTCAGMYAAYELEPSPMFSAAYTLGLFWIIAAYCVRARASDGSSGVMDAGFFYGSTWPFALPYVLFRHHGFRKGAMAIAALLSVYVMPFMVTLILMTIVQELVSLVRS